MRLLTLREVERAFEVDHNTLIKWLNRLEIEPVRDEMVDRRRRLLTYEQVEQVAQQFGRRSALAVLAGKAAESPRGRSELRSAGPEGSGRSERVAEQESMPAAAVASLLVEVSSALLAIAQAEQILLQLPAATPTNIAAAIAIIAPALRRLASAQTHMTELIGMMAEPVDQANGLSDVLTTVAASIHDGMATIQRLADVVEQRFPSADIRALRDAPFGSPPSNASPAVDVT